MTAHFWYIRHIRAESCGRTNRHFQTHLLEQHRPSARLVAAIEVEKLTFLNNDERRQTMTYDDIQSFKTPSKDAGVSLCAVIS